MMASSGGHEGRSPVRVLPARKSEPGVFGREAGMDSRAACGEGGWGTRVVVDVDGRRLDLDWTGYQLLRCYIIGTIEVKDVYRSRFGNGAAPDAAVAGSRIAEAV